MESIPLTHGKHNYNQVEPHTRVSFILPYKRNVRQLTVPNYLDGRKPTIEQSITY